LAWLLLCVALSDKRSRNNLAARLAVHRQWRRRMHPSKWPRLMGHRQVNLTDRLQVSLAADLQGRA
jgi:hypothetical protein